MREFEPFGEVDSLKIDEKSHAFAFVAFKKNEDAQAALTHFNKASEGLEN